MLISLWSPGSFIIQWNLYNETGKVLLKTHKYHHSPDTVLTKSCLFSLPWKTTCLERPQNLVVALYRFYCIKYPYTVCYTSDVICRQTFWSALTQGMVFGLRHQAFTWINVDLSSNVSCGIRLGVIAQIHPQIYCNMFWDYTFKIATTYLRYQWVNSLHQWSGLMPGLHPANERRCYKVMLSRIGWVQT